MTAPDHKLSIVFMSEKMNRCLSLDLLNLVAREIKMQGYNEADLDWLRGEYIACRDALNAEDLPSMLKGEE